MDKYTVYTDGGCINNPGGKGGIGAIVLKNGYIVNQICKGYKSTTNNRMELRAAIEALKTVPSGSKVELYSDSQYLVKTMNGQFKMGKNMDLWQQLISASKDKSIKWQWVKGHNNNEYNEMCDYLAGQAMCSDELYTDYIGTSPRLF